MLAATWMSTERKETGATTTDDSSLEILPGMWTLGTAGTAYECSNDRLQVFGQWSEGGGGLYLISSLSSLK